MAESFSDILTAYTDDNGTIGWTIAADAARAHGRWDDFRTEYGTTAKFGRVDTGEFLVWLGY